MKAYRNEAQQKKAACMIWMHGLGASGRDMFGLAEQLTLAEPVHHVFLDAPIRPVTLNNRMQMRAWYDIVGMQLTDREDQAGIGQSETIIQNAIQQQIEDGFAAHQIFLAGFSQGGAMALYTGLQTTLRLGGIVSLSAYLPLAASCEPKLAKDTPIFVAAGRFDPIVLPAWTQQSFQWLTSQQFSNVVWHDYAMEHFVCLEELRDLSSWLNAHMPNDQRLPLE